MIAISIYVIVFCLARHCHGIPTNRLFDLHGFEDSTPVRRKFTANDFQGKYSRFMELTKGGQICPQTLDLLSNGLVLNDGSIKIPLMDTFLNKELCNSNDNLIFRFGQRLAKETIENVFKLPVDSEGIDAFLRGILMDIKDFYYGVEENAARCGEVTLFAGTVVLFTSDSDVFGEELQIPFRGHPKIAFLRNDQMSCAYSGTWSLMTNTKSDTEQSREPTSVAVTPAPVTVAVTPAEVATATATETEMIPAALTPPRSTSVTITPAPVTSSAIVSSNGTPSTGTKLKTSSTRPPDAKESTPAVAAETTKPNVSVGPSSSNEFDVVLPSAKPISSIPSEETIGDGSTTILPIPGSSGPVVSMTPQLKTSSTPPPDAKESTPAIAAETTKPNLSVGPSSSKEFVVVLPSAKPISSIPSGETIGDGLTPILPILGSSGPDVSMTPGNTSAIPSPNSMDGEEMGPDRAPIPVDLMESASPSSTAAAPESAPFEVILGSPSTTSPTSTPANSGMSVSESDSTPEVSLDSSPEPSFASGSAEASPTLSSPNSSTGNSTSDDGSTCFPAHSLARLSNGNNVRMDKLRVGDLVHVGNGIVSAVIGFSHSDDLVLSRFIKFTTDSGKSVAVSPTHFMYTSRGLLAGREISTGDYLRLEDGRPTKVTRTEMVVAKGLFNPHTSQGNVVVDGFIASTYTSAVEPNAAHALLAPIRVLERLGILSSIVPRLSRNRALVNSVRSVLNVQ